MEMIAEKHFEKDVNRVWVNLYKTRKDRLTPDYEGPQKPCKKGLMNPGFRFKSRAFWTQRSDIVVFRITKQPCGRWGPSVLVSHGCHRPVLNSIWKNSSKNQSLVSF